MRTVASSQPSTGPVNVPAGPEANRASVPAREPIHGANRVGLTRFGQASGVTSPAVDALTRVDIACRHLGAKRAPTTPQTPPTHGRGGPRVAYSLGTRYSQWCPHRFWPRWCCFNRLGRARDPRWGGPLETRPPIYTLGRRFCTIVAKRGTCIGKRLDRVHFVWESE